jgi:glycerol-3-phosphate dehydrogenase (NAD(P)+)
MTRSSVAVLGAGAWGAALANVAAHGRDRVLLWDRDAEHIAALARDRENRRYLPGSRLAAAVVPTSELGDIAESDIVLAVTPAQTIRSLFRLARPLVRKRAAMIVCAKGVERDRRKFMSEIVAEEVPQAQIAILSGPSFAADVCKGLPTAVTLAAFDETLAQELCEQLATKNFRLYRSTDVRGVEIGGAAKNVFAIACGMAAGRGLGASAQAALIARSFAELTRLGRALGARQETLMGLSGLGDLVLTCGSEQSRNFALGLALGRGEPREDGAHGKLAEGSFTAKALVQMAAAQGVEMPIVQAVDAILDARLSVEAAVEGLLMRPLAAEA